MEPIIFVMMISTIFIVVQSIVVVFLVKRARETGLKNIWLLAISCAIFVAVALAGIGGSPVQIILQPFGPLVIVFFVRDTFFKNTKSFFKLIFLIAAAFTILTITVKIIRIIIGDPPFFYLLNQLLLLVVFAVSYAWFAHSSVKSFLRMRKNSSIEPWIRKRYRLLTGSSIATMCTTVPSLFMGGTENFYTINGFFVVLFIVSDLLVFSSLNYLCWIMPAWFKKRINEGILLEDEARFVEFSVPATDRLKKALTNRETMAIVDYLGNVLASLIKKSAPAAKGLLLMAIDTEFGDWDMQILDYSDLNKVISQSLKAKLEQLGFNDASTITSRLADELRNNQSLLVMMTV
nr:hypothetical protein [Candidatus Sigynarchaeota archaeon]